jgi:RNA polymerase-binding protein DksA
MTSQTRAKTAERAETIRRTLQAERGAGESLLTDLDGQLAAMQTAAVASNRDDEHDPEGSTVAFEAAQLQTLRERAEKHLAEIDGAIARLNAGTYGICERCERPIGAPRLAALPAAELCVDCAGSRR